MNLPIGFWRLLAPLALSGLISTPAMASKDVWVKADTGLTGVRVSASMGVDADPSTLWKTLTDYDRLTQFVPSMVVSRTISKPGRPLRVEQRADSGMFSFMMPDHVVLAMEEHAPDLIRFRAVSGSVVAMSGEWRILGKSRPVRLVYRAHVLPMVPPPPLVSDSFIEDEVRKRFEAVGREAERRDKELQSTYSYAPGQPARGYLPAPGAPGGYAPTYVQEYVPKY